MNQEVNLELSVKKPFGPRIGKTSIPKKIIDKLNNFVDNEIEKSQELAKSLDYGPNLAGEVKQEIRIPEHLIIPDLHSYLLNITRTYINVTTGKDISKFEIMQTWIVRQFENEYNPVHTHSGHISGVGYIKLPDNFGRSFQNKNENVNGMISFTYGVKQFLSTANVNFTPKLGDFYIFPNYLFHSVYPFYGPGERRSISFNAKIDNNIYDVYSG